MKTANQANLNEILTTFASEVVEQRDEYEVQGDADAVEEGNDLLRIIDNALVCNEKGVFDDPEAKEFADYLIKGVAQATIKRLKNSDNPMEQLTGIGQLIALKELLEEVNA